MQLTIGKKSLEAYLSIVEVLLISYLFLVTLPRTSLAETIFGNDYRHLTTVDPGGSNTSTSISIAAGVAGVGTYVINPLTSASTLQDAPSTTSLSGYGWRTAGLVGMNVPAGTWNFTVTTQSTVGTGTAHVVVFAYSTATSGGDIQNIGSATGTTNVIGILSSQTETVSFSAPAIDLTDRILVVEYWLDVTTGPTLVAAEVTFKTNSSSETAVVPTSPSTTYYLGMAQLHSLGLDESLSTSESTSKNVIPLISENLFAVEFISIQVSFPELELISITDGISITITKPLSEAATVSDIPARDYLSTRFVSDLLAAQDIVGAGNILQLAASDVLGFQDQIAAVKTQVETDEIEESDSGGNGDGARRVQIVNPLKRVTINELVLSADDQITTAKTLNITPNETVIIRPTIKNEQSQLQPFAFIVQITDSEGYTQAIELVSGIIDPNKTQEVEVSLPAFIEGHFSGRIFTWSGLQNGEPLSPVHSIELFVNQFRGTE